MLPCVAYNNILSFGINKRNCPSGAARITIKHRLVQEFRVKTTCIKTNVKNASFASFRETFIRLPIVASDLSRDHMSATAVLLSSDAFRLPILRFPLDYRTLSNNLMATCTSLVISILSHDSRYAIHS